MNGSVMSVLVVFRQWKGSSASTQPKDDLLQDLGDVHVYGNDGCGPEGWQGSMGRRWYVSQPLSVAIVTPKQPQAVSKWRGVAVTQ